MVENKETKIVPGIIYTDGRKVTPNEKSYLVLIKGDIVSNENLEYRDFEWIVGRQRLYEYLRDLILNEEDFIVDIHKTVIISDTVYINDFVSMYEFMTYSKDLVIDDTGFDIEEYNVEGVVDIEPEA